MFDPVSYWRNKKARQIAADFRDFDRDKAFWQAFKKWLTPSENLALPSTTAAPARSAWRAGPGTGRG